ncbi:hypothetical protein ABZX75_26140 [Streptomyces sp. NPDC003038]|uniref:hypothetical protein n=1 Tax=unclassified Streptomyces TaxID=2593676 RepID=UPI0033AAFE54
MTTDVQSTKQEAYKRGEEQGRADANAGRPHTEQPRDGARGEKDYYANGYDWGYEQALAQKLDLVVWQEGGVEDAPGGMGSTLNVCVRTPNSGDPVDAGQVEHVFTAPSGFRWNGHVGAQYKHIDQTTSGHLPTVKATVSDDGRTLKFTYPVHLNTSAEDKDILVYICGIEAVDGARPGRYSDGSAQVGGAPAGKLKASVLDPDED